MVQINSFNANKTEVEKGETFTYTIWVKNTLSTGATLRVHFYENTLDHELNTQSVMVGGNGAAVFQLNLVANQSPGYVYQVCAWLADGMGDVVSACAPDVTIPEDSVGLQVTKCEVDKTAVDGGATVRYTMTVTNGSGVAQYAYVEFCDRDLDEVIYENSTRFEPHETKTFEHLLVCATLGRKYRVCGQLVTPYGDTSVVYNMTCAPAVQVSGVWGTAKYELSVTAGTARVEPGSRGGIGVVARVKNVGGAGGSPMVLFSAKNAKTGAVVDCGGSSMYIAEGTALDFVSHSLAPDEVGVYEATVTIEGTALTKTVTVGVGVDPEPDPDPKPEPTPSGLEIPPIAIVAGTAVLGGVALYFLGPRLGLGGE